MQILTENLKKLRATLTRTTTDKRKENDFFWLELVDGKLHVTSNIGTLYLISKFGVKCQQDEVLGVGVHQHDFIDMINLSNGSVIELSSDFGDITAYQNPYRTEPEDAIMLKMIAGNSVTKFKGSERFCSPPNVTLSNHALINGKVFSDAFNTVKKAISKVATSHEQYTNVHCEFLPDNKIRMFATNGVIYLEKIITAKHNNPGVFVNFPKTIDKMFDKLKKVNIKIGVDETQRYNILETGIVQIVSIPCQNTSQNINDVMKPVHDDFRMKSTNFQIYIDGYGSIKPGNIKRAMLKSDTFTLSAQCDKVEIIANTEEDGTSRKTLKVECSEGLGEIKLYTSNFSKLWQAVGSTCLIEVDGGNLKISSDTVTGYMVGGL